MLRRVLCFLAAAAAAVPAQSAWIGNPAHPLDGSSTGLAYDTAERDVVDGTPGVALDMDSRGFFLEHRTSLNPAFQWSLRVLPFTGRTEIEGASFNPHMAGGGLGLHFSPPEPLGPVHVGVQALWNGAAGARRRPSTPGADKEYDRIYWSELSLAAGASWAPVELLSVYGGASFTKLDVHFNLGGARSDWEGDQPWGAFAGVELNPDEAWTVAAEIRTGHEQAFSASLRYNY